MRGNELLDKMELIDPAYIEAADAAPNKRKSAWAKWGAAAACLCLICGLAVPTIAAFSPSFYELLYAVSPATAQFFAGAAVLRRQRHPHGGDGGLHPREYRRDLSLTGGPDRNELR
ncbi:MAG: hypothetical protein ACLSHO_11875 [Dysosmobacter sp.]